MVNRTSHSLHKLIILLDFIVVNAAVSLYYYHDLGQIVPMNNGVGLPLLLLVANASLAIAQLFFSNIVYEHYKAIDKVLRQVCLLSFVYGALFICLMQSSDFFFDTPYPEVGFTLWCIAATVGALVCVRMVEYIIVRFARRYGRNSRSLLFVGDSNQIGKSFIDINLPSHAGLRAIGYYSDSPLKEQPRIQMKHLGTLADLREHIKNDDCRLSDDIYCTDMPGNNELITELVNYAMRKGIQFNYIPPFFNNFGYCLKPRVEGELIVFSNLNEPLLSMGNRIVKRTFDLVVSGMAILVMLPFIPIIGAIIKISSPGPIFFKQKRTGLNGEDFNMLKFRSMHVNKDADSIQATKDDPRKFAFGSFMRQTGIDELPQFFNVFKGDMSIVGPRPHMLAHTEEYRHKINEYMLRHLVRPGITGWAQVTGFRGETPELWQMEGRVQRDLWYIQNWSFWLDVRIVFRTALTMIIRDEKAF